MIFHYEKIMRRTKKIKSRKHQKDMTKDRELLAEEGYVALEYDVEKEESLIDERRRIEGSVIEQHKNTSKWNSQQFQRREGKRDESTIVEIENRLRIHEELD